MMPRFLRRWSPEDLAALHRLLAEGETHAQIAAFLETSVQRVKARVCWEGKDETQRARRREQIQNSRVSRRNGYTTSNPRGGSATTASRPAPELLADATRRLLAPRTIGAAQFGDPPPGYSALDRKRANISEPAHIDARNAKFRRKPSLPGGIEA